MILFNKEKQFIMKLNDTNTRSQIRTEATKKLIDAYLKSIDYDL